MSSIQIPCPQCGRELRIRDRNLLGRKGKCPKCGRTFVLTEPELVELELSEPSGSPIGTAASWVPDTAPAPQPSPPMATPFAPQPAVTDFAAITATSDSALRLKALRRRKAKRRNVAVVVALVTLLVAGGAIFAIQHMAPPSAAVTVTNTATPASAPVNAPTDKTPPSALPESPTKGAPITLNYIPSGSRIVIHLRPAELWQPNSQGEEFRYCLGPLAEWVGQKLKEISRREPVQIEEALICLIPAMRGTPPDVASVIRLKEDARRSDLIEQFPGEPKEIDGQMVYVSGGTALLIADLKTLAFAPEKYADELARAAQVPNPTAPGIEELLPLTDRRRHLTVVFEPSSARLDDDLLVPETVRPFFERFLDWFGNDVETVAWSVHLAPETFYSEVLLRNVLTTRPLELELATMKRLDSLPRTVLAMVERMNPPERGKRRIIGRFPAMTKVFAMATQAETGPRHVRLVTALSERAAPNLALGTLLTWDESTRTDFTKQAPTAPTPTPGTKPAESLADRLKKKIDVDFRRTPLEEAFTYIADETKVPIQIDGDALKLSGYTKNMPQTMKLDQITGVEAISEILKNYDKLCLVLDEQKQQALVTTLPVAEQRKLKPFLPKPK